MQSGLAWPAPFAFVTRAMLDFRPHPSVNVREANRFGCDECEEQLGAERRIVMIMVVSLGRLVPSKAR